MQATQAPQPEADFQEVIEVEEEDEPAPKRKKKTSVAAREWEHNFALLEAFRRREGHADVPPGYKVGGTALRVWLDNQRQRCSARVNREDALLPEEECNERRGAGAAGGAGCAVAASELASGGVLSLAPSSRVRVPVKP